MATKVHVILKRSTLLTWMHDNKELVQYVILWSKTKSKYCHNCSIDNNDNDENVMRATVSFEWFGELLNVKT